MRRYIYIHGCPEEDLMGIPSSHGCIKMRNAEVIELFDRVSAGTRVLIQEAPL
jgi:lipoprotein-anchoring transpeptidase ErfK/SrfK